MQIEFVPEFNPVFQLPGAFIGIPVIVVPVLVGIPLCGGFRDGGFFCFRSNQLIDIPLERAKTLRCILPAVEDKIGSQTRLDTSRRTLILMAWALKKASSFAFSSCKCVPKTLGSAALAMGVTGTPDIPSAYCCR